MTMHTILVAIFRLNSVSLLHKLFWCVAPLWLQCDSLIFKYKLKIISHSHRLC